MNLFQTFSHIKLKTPFKSFDSWNTRYSGDTLEQTIEFAHKYYSYSEPMRIVDFRGIVIFNDSQIRMIIRDRKINEIL